MSRLPITRSCCDDHTRYHPGCRPCMDRAARWQKQYEYERAHGLTRKVPSAPFVEMVGRLNANGWPGYVIAEKIGWAGPHFTRWQLERRSHLTVGFAERITKVVLELADYPGPSTITRARAIAAGYAPYLDRPVDEDPVVDDVAIRRALEGDREVLATLNREEKDEAIRLALARGWLPHAVSDRLGANIQRVRRVARGEKRGEKRRAA